MADTKISALTAASVAADANEIPINEAGTSKKITNSQVVTYLATKGLAPAYVTTVDSDVTGTNGTALQNIFPAAQDTFTAVASTAYLFELFMSVTNGATTCTKSLAFNGGACTFTSIRYWYMGQTIAINSQGATQNSGHTDTAASTACLATGTASWFIFVQGMMRINGAGTMIPQFQFSADPTGTILIKKDSYMIMRPVGTNTFAANGAWA